MFHSRFESTELVPSSSFLAGMMAQSVVACLTRFQIDCILIEEEELLLRVVGSRMNPILGLATYGTK